MSDPPAAVPPSASQSYDPAFFAGLAEIEDRHFWFRTRNRVLAQAARRLTAGLSPGYRVLEVGCGTGNVLRVLERACPGGRVLGMDLFEEGLRFARARTRAHLVQGDVHRLPFSVRFDLVGLFDVLEHLPDDRRLLAALRNVVAPGGTLLITVPAHPSLWSYFDEASKHCRRYRPADLRTKLAEAGFTVEFCTQYMLAILPLVWLHRKWAPLLERWRGDDEARNVYERAQDELRIVPGINALLTWALLPEVAWLGRGWRLPLGTSLLAVARRPAGD